MATPQENTPLKPPNWSQGGGTFESLGHTSPRNGLSSEEAERRLKEFGPNKLEASAKVPFYKILLTQAKNVIFLLTTIAANISFITGERTKAYVLIGIVVVVCTANAIGEYTGQDAGDALKKMSAAEAVAIRDGAKKSVPVEDLVVGDVVLLQVGDVVPADMLIMECTDLQTNEALLTGESMESKKTDHPSEATDSAFLPNWVYKETSVVAGSGRCEVIATGMATQVGQIALRLDGQAVELNPLQLSINKLGGILGVACVAMLVSATTISYVTGYQNPMTPCADDDGHCLFMSSLLRGLLMAVSLIPHGLPLVVMVMLRVGKAEMKKQNGVVTKVSAVDYLGAAQVICTDKTGTLTEGKMTAKAIFSLCRPGESKQCQQMSFAFHPLPGLSPNGGLFREEELTDTLKKTLTDQVDPGKKSQRFTNLGSAEDLADPATKHESDLSTEQMLARAQLACAFLACPDAVLQKDKKGHWFVDGSMTEAALKVAAAKGNYWDDEGPGASLRKSHARVADLEIAFTSARKMMATVHELPASKNLKNLAFGPEATHVALLKGAPDRIIPHLSAVLYQDRFELKALPGKMTAEERGILEKQNKELAGKALRTFIMAFCPLTAAEVSSMKDSGDADARLEFLKNSAGLCFLSLWGIYDPPRAAVPGSVQECHEAGIRVVMITGDQYTTGQAIAKQVGILNADIEGAKNCTELHVKSINIPSHENITNSISIDASKKLEETRRSSPHLQQRRSSKPGAVKGAMQEMHRTLSVSEKTKHDVQTADYLSQEEIAELTSSTHVWARAQPTDKVTIVESLQLQGNVSAMTGDGVNDAPALKKAGVGVSMGISGTEVAKSAADLVLLDDNFSTIVSAIREGRRIYVNTQKYVTFNLSVKSSECLCLMLSICLGTPMPIRGLQLLINLVCTHIIPPMSLAIEGPEPYLMYTPPRKTKGDLVVSRLMLLYRWLPFVVCMPLAVMSCLTLGVWSHTGFFHGNSLIGTSRVSSLERGLVACEIAGSLDANEEFIEDPSPFHCRCSVHPGGMPWAAAEQVDQWGRIVGESELTKAFDPWSGSTGDLYSKDSTPWREGAKSLLDPCKDRKGVERWCWRDSVKEDLPLLPPGLHCAAYGTQLGQTMAYVSIHLGEILSLMSFRMDSFFLASAFSNWCYNGLLLFNLTALLIAVYVPHVRHVLQLAPLTPGRFLVAMCFALFLMVLNESAKVLFRNRQSALHAVQKQEALRLASGGHAKKIDEVPV